MAYVDENTSDNSASGGTVYYENNVVYCMFWMDLRAEPLVLTVPEMEPERFYHFQLIDLQAREDITAVSAHVLGGDAREIRFPESVRVSLSLDGDNSQLRDAFVIHGDNRQRHVTQIAGSVFHPVANFP